MHSKIILQTIMIPSLFLELKTHLSRQEAEIKSEVVGANGHSPVQKSEVFLLATYYLLLATFPTPYPLSPNPWLAH
jgi:hypothetical protein